MPSTSNGKALVLGVDDRSALTVTRSLGRQGIAVHLGSDADDSICRLSKYTRQVIPFPDSGRNPDEWVCRLEEQLVKEPYDLVIPTADNYLLLVAKHRTALDKHARLAIPDERGIRYTYDKRDTLALARSVGVPCPTTIEISDPSQLKQLRQDLGLPLVLKPVSSRVWRRGRRYSLRPEMVQSEEQLVAVMGRLLKVCPVLAQSYHSGFGVGLEFLSRDGETIAVFQHQRVHEPKSGGGSSYRKSVAVDPVLREYSERMLGNLGWTGVAMVEYRFDPATGKSVLMEINGRFWGSLPLAVAAGVDFPFWLYEMLVHQRTPRSVTFREGIYGRNPVKDLEWMKENLRADVKDPYRKRVPWSQVALEFSNLLRGRERLDTIVLDDPWPGVIQLGRYLVQNLLTVRNKVHRIITKNNYRYNPRATKKNKRAIRRLLSDRPAVVTFVCKGNICRSPFAGVYMASLLGKANPGDVLVESCGLIERTGRKSPESSISAAASLGVDLSAHQSELLTKDTVQRSCVLFVMDIDLYQRVRSQFPGANGKLFYLGIYSGKASGGVEILDPYGKGEEKMREIFQRITHCIDALIEEADLR